MLLQTNRRHGSGEFTRGRRFTPEIHEFTRVKKQTVHRRERNRGNDGPPQHPGDLHKTRNEPMPDFHRISFPLFTKPIPHLLILRYGSCISNPRGVHPPRNPHALCSKHRTATVRPNRTFDDPTPTSQPHKCQACHETERTEICRVSDEAVRA